MYISSEPPPPPIVGKKHNLHRSRLDGCNRWTVKHLECSSIHFARRAIRNLPRSSTLDVIGTGWNLLATPCSSSARAPRWFTPIPILRSILWFHMLLHDGIAWHYLALHGVAWYCLVLFGIAWCGMVLFGFLWYCLVSHNIAWYWMVLLSRVPH